jgi:hypothetical protein
MAFFERRRPPRRGGNGPNVDRSVQVQVERVRGLVEALMFDIAAWLAGASHPVTPEVFPRYPFNELRRLPSPRERMLHYVAGSILDSWGAVMDRWVSSGLRLQPYFDQRLELEIDGLGGSKQVLATFRFPNRSIVLVGDRREYCDSTWQMTVRISPTLKRIDSCVLRPAGRGREGD